MQHTKALTSVTDRTCIYFKRASCLRQYKNHKHPLTAIIKISTAQFWVVTHETFQRSVQVGSTNSENLTLTLLGNTCFMYDNSKLSCWNVRNGCLWFSIVRDRMFFRNKYWYANRSQFHPPPCNRILESALHYRKNSAPYICSMGRYSNSNVTILNKGLVLFLLITS